MVRPNELLNDIRSMVAAVSAVADEVMATEFGKGYVILAQKVDELDRHMTANGLSPDPWHHRKIDYGKDGD